MATLAQNTHKHHDYHLVDPSPWPLMSAFAALIMGISAVFYFHWGHIWGLIIGGALLIYTVFRWWADVVKEAHDGHHTPLVRLHFKYGMLLFIISEIMFFIAWFWAYYDASLFPSWINEPLRIAFIGKQWPPKGVETFDPMDFPIVSTLVLLTSGATMNWALQAVSETNKKELIWSLGLTVLLGLSFTALQINEYVHAPFTFKNHIYGSVFFMATGFHGFHVIVGTIFLIVCFFRAQDNELTPIHHVGLEAAAWYWRFVDAVWIVLFIAIYVLGRSNPTFA